MRASPPSACVLVLGMHRSGTSAMTRAVNAMGAALPTNLIPAFEDNEEGFWESADIVTIHNRFMVALGFGWNDPRVLPAEAYRTPAAETCRQELMAVLRRDFASERLFVIKDPRISVLMPLWLELLRDFGAAPHVILGFRHPDEVADSLTKRRDGFVDTTNQPIAHHGQAVWLIHNLEAERHSRGLPRVIVSYDQVLEDPVASARALADALGCFDPAKVAEGLEFARTHFKTGMRNHASSGSDRALPNWVERMYAWLEAAARGEAAPVDDLDAITLALTQAQELYGPLMRAGRPSPAVFKPPVLIRLKRRLAQLQS